ncbi:unnamed protein product [Ectocarpus sp. CCAP 1310/34]|nr:unnamed protein product [Ectocarpus sp. CCAP 1310/34]
MDGGRQPNPPPPRPARASAGVQNLETHVAKPQPAGGGSQLPRGATRRSVSCAGHNVKREARRSPSTKAAAAAAAAAAAPPPPQAAGGRSRSKSSSSPPPPPLHRTARAPSLPAESSSSITGAQMPSAAAANDDDGDLSPAEALPTRSVFIATAVLVGKRNQQRNQQQQQQQQREERTSPNWRGKEEEGGVSRSSGGSSRGGGGASRTPSPSLTRRVWASTSSRFGSSGSCGGGEDCEGCVGCVSIRRLSTGSSGSNGGVREGADPVALWRSYGRDDDVKGGSIARATAAEASAEQKAKAPATTVSPTARFYDYWRHCNFRAASTVRSATKNMADDILSTAGEDNEKIAVPAPLDPVTSARAAPLIPATKRSRGLPAGQDGELVAGGGNDGAGNVESESAAAAAAEAREDRKDRAEAGAKARTAFAAAAVAERRTEDAKLRLGELRSRPDNRQEEARSDCFTALVAPCAWEGAEGGGASGIFRCADCGAPCADWASVAHGSFVCLKCAGQHRSLGMQVIFTRSLVMDKWTG